MTSPAQILDRSPLHSLEAEMGVLGSMLLDARVADDVALNVKADEFYSPNYRRVFEALMELHREGRRIDDLKMLGEHLRSKGDYETIGGDDLITQISESLPIAANAVWYAKTVRGNAIRRDLVLASTETLRDVYDQTIDARELAGMATQRAADVVDRRSSAELVDCADVARLAIESFGDRSDRGVPTGLATGFADVDAFLGGLRDGELIIAAARPGAGKTSFALDVAAAVGGRGAVALFVSLEMSRLELGERLIAAQSSVPLEVIRRGTKNAANRSEAVAGAGAVAGLQIVFDDSPMRTVVDIAAAARSLKRRRGLSLLVVDYLQLVTAENTRDPREQQVAKIARRLKTLARELRTPVLCLAQLNRDVDKQADHRPRLSHLRESGAIEQDADVVLFIHREEMFRPDDLDLRGRAELIVAKNRNGRTGTVPLLWLPHVASFSSIEAGAQTENAQAEFSFS